MEAKLYESEEALIQDALRSLLGEKPQLRIELAIYRYQTEDISLAKAANIAGGELRANEGDPIEPGHSTPAREEALEEISALRGHLDATNP